MARKAEYFNVLQLRWESLNEEGRSVKNLQQFLTRVVSVAFNLGISAIIVLSQKEHYIYIYFFLILRRKYPGHIRVRMSNSTTRRVKDIPV